MVQGHLDEGQVGIRDGFQHGLADAKILVMQAELESGPVGTGQHGLAAVIEEPVACRAGGNDVDHPVHVEPQGLPECQGFGHRLVDARRHELVDRLARLAAARRADVGNVGGDSGQHGPYAIQHRFIAAGHHRKRPRSCPLNAAGHRAVEKVRLSLDQHRGGAPGGFTADG